MVAAEHQQNLSAQAPDSLLHSLTSEWQRPSPQPALLNPSHLQAARSHLDFGGSLSASAGLDGSGRDSLLNRVAMRSFPEENAEQMTPAVYEAQRMQRLGSLLQTEGESLENALHSATLHQQRRDNLLQQHQFAGSGFASSADARSRLLLQQQLGGRPTPSAAGINAPFFQSGPSLRPHQPTHNSPYLSQLSHASRAGNVAGAGANWNLEQLIARRTATSIQHPGSGLSTDETQRLAQQQQDPSSGALTPEELRYLAEQRRRRGA